MTSTERSKIISQFSGVHSSGSRPRYSREMVISQSYCTVLRMSASLGRMTRVSSAGSSKGNLPSWNSAELVSSV